VTAVAAVLFDMDGTLLDSERLWDISLSELSERLGGPLTTQTRQRVIGGELSQTVRIIHRSLGLDADGEDESARWLLNRTAELFATQAQWMPNALELVAQVRQSELATALVTSSSRILVNAVLTTEIARMFDAVVSVDDVRNPKPHPEPYLMAAAQLSVAPGHCVALEDSVRGAAAARAAGCAVVAVGSELLPTVDADIVVPSLAAVSVEMLRDLGTMAPS